MEISEQVREEIKEYVFLDGWSNKSLLTVGLYITIYPSYFCYSKKGKQKNLLEKWAKDPEKMDKYLLEYLGHILRKYKITEMVVFNDKCDNKYVSDNWNFKDIKKK